MVGRTPGPRGTPASRFLVNDISITQTRERPTGTRRPRPNGSAPPILQPLQQARQKSPEGRYRRDFESLAGAMHIHDVRSE
jgi:hypothetical protein